MSPDAELAVPWPPERAESDPLRDVAEDRFMVFVPAIMSVGLVFSITTLVRDAFQRLGRRTAERRIRIETASTLEALLEPAGAKGTTLGLHARSSYLLTAFGFATAAVAMTVLAVVGFTADGDVGGIAWLLALELVAAAMLAVVAAASWDLFSGWPAGSPATLAIIRVVPLTVNPAGLGRGPRRLLTEALLVSALLTAILTVIVDTRAGLVGRVDEPMLEFLADIGWLRHLATVDVFGSTVISIGFVVLIGLSAFRCRVMALVYPAAFVVSWLSNTLLQEVVQRTRPIEFGDVKAFPSGHMVQAVFIAGLLPTALGVLLPFKHRTVLFMRLALGALVVSTGVLRVHREDHWPLDVLAGVFLGLTVVFGVHWVLEHRTWHQRCSTCQWSDHPDVTPWAKGLFDLDPRLARWAGWLGAGGALAAAGALAALTSVVGLPTDPEGDGLGSAVAEPGQLGLAALMGFAGLLALRWKAIAAFLMAVSATGLGLLASVEYAPTLTFALAAMLLIPAVLTWLAWHPHETIGTIAALALVTVTSLTATALGSREIYDHYYGPTHPSSQAAPLDSDAEWLWLGGVTPRSATVVAGGLPAGAATTLTAWTDAGVSRTVSSPADGDGVARFELADLAPATHYSYTVTTQVPADPGDRPDGTFSTHAEGAQHLEVLVASCAQNDSNGAVFDAMVSQDADLYLALGDLHYASLESTDPDDHLRQYARSLGQPGQARLFSSVPTAYVWDDHDYGPNDGDSTSPSRRAASEAYRQAVPHFGVDPDLDASIAQAFSVGRVRFVMTDTRSQRTADTMLGETQLEWLIDEVTAASRTHALVVWSNPTPWISSSGPGADDWSAYPDERRHIADALVAADVDNLLMVSGDAHMLAIDDGTNSGYASDGSPGFPVLHAAALDRPGSVKGGPYSHGAIGGSGQFGIVNIADEGGDTITVTLRGQNWRGEELLRYEYVVQVAPDVTG